MLDHHAVRVGITPTGWTNDDFPTIGEEIAFEHCLSEIALAGYDGCSVGHKFPSDPAALREALSLRGLTISEPWVSTYFTITGMRERTLQRFREQMDFIKAVGGDRIVVAELGRAVHQLDVALAANKPVLGGSDWSSLHDGLNELGALAAAEGLLLVYHPHMGTVVQARSEVDRLMAGTDPGLVHLLLDTGHLTWAGGDPVALVRDHGRRLAHVHLKDLRPDVLMAWHREDHSFREAILAGIFTVPGDGLIEFEPIFAALDDAGFHGWLVVEAEQDPAKAHPLTYALRAREYLRTVAGL
jgi:inosose dehydratase